MQTTLDQKVQAPICGAGDHRTRQIESKIAWFCYVYLRADRDRQKLNQDALQIAAGICSGLSGPLVHFKFVPLSCNLVGNASYAVIVKISWARLAKGNSQYGL
jgi:hypothetical protein